MTLPRKSFPSRAFAISVSEFPFTIDTVSFDFLAMADALTSNGEEKPGVHFLGRSAKYSFHESLGSGTASGFFRGSAV